MPSEIRRLRPCREESGEFRPTVHVSSRGGKHLFCELPRGRTQAEAIPLRWKRRSATPYGKQFTMTSPDRGPPAPTALAERQPRLRYAKVPRSLPPGYRPDRPEQQVN